MQYILPNVDDFYFFNSDFHIHLLYGDLSLRIKIIFLFTFFLISSRSFSQNEGEIENHQFYQFQALSEAMMGFNLRLTYILNNFEITSDFRRSTNSLKKARAKLETILESKFNQDLISISNYTDSLDSDKINSYKSILNYVDDELLTSSKDIKLKNIGIKTSTYKHYDKKYEFTDEMMRYVIYIKLVAMRIEIVYDEVKEKLNTK